MRARPTLFMLLLPLLALGATGCHRHHMARSCQPLVPQQVVEAAPPPAERIAGTTVYIYVSGGATVETQPSVEQATREAADRDAATQEQARIEQARVEQARVEQARIERERAEQERIARAEQERIEHERAAQAAQRAKGSTTVIVISPGSPPQVIPPEAWITQ